MQIRCGDFIKELESWAPLSYAEEWDNCGLHVGRQEKQLQRVMVALTPSADAIDAAIAAKVDLLLTHHPLLFSGIKQINDTTLMGKNLIRLLQADVCVYCAHTNLDAAAGGVNDILATAIGIAETAPLAPITVDGALTNCGIGRIGTLPSAMPFGVLVEQIGKNLGCRHLAYQGDWNRPVQKIALCGGSGMEYLQSAAAKGVDVYVTGDVKYHNAQLAAELGICLVDAGHFGTEYPIVEKLAGFARERGLEVLVYEESDFLQHWTMKNNLIP